MTGEINKLRQLLCKEPTPELKSKVCAQCTDDMLWDYAESVISGLKEWAARQQEIAVNLEKHGRRHDEGEDYDECRFKMKNLEGADLIGADLRSANLRSANLTGANLYRAYLTGANLSGAYLRSANLRSANLRSANLRSANLRSANLRFADLSSANLSRARYNAETRFPEGFSPSERGMVEVEE